MYMISRKNQVNDILQYLCLWLSLITEHDFQKLKIQE